MKRSFFLFTILFLLSFNLLFSQGTDEYLKTLKTAEALMNQRMYKEGILLLEPWYESFPYDPYLVSLLRKGYSQTKSYEKLKKLFLRQIEKNPNDWMSWCIVGDAQLKLDQQVSADTSFQKAIDAGKEHPDVYQAVANFYLLNGLTYKAIEVYSQGNLNLKSNIFSKDIAHLFEALKEYGSAVEKYFEFMGGDTNKYNIIESQILNLINEGEDLDGIELALKKIIEKKTLDKWVYPLYGVLFLKRGKLEPAFQIYRKVDFLWGGKGGYVLFFAKKCYQDKAYDLAISVCDYLLSSYPESPILAQVKLCKAKSLMEKKNYKEAISEYQEIIETYKKTPAAFEAIFQIGEMEFSFLFNIFEAKIWFKKILDFPRSERFDDALIRIGDCFLVIGELDSAYLWYNRVQKDVRAKDKWEEAKFKLAEIDFYKGEFDEAEKGYNLVVLEYPKGFFVNNSLERLALLKENKASNLSLLLLFSEGSLEKTKRNYKKSTEIFQRILNFENQKLSDLCELEIALIQKEEGEFENSIFSLKKLQQNYPESPYSPLAQKLIGDFYYYHLNDKVEAEKSYQVLLKNYSKSLFVEEVREKLKKLKKEKSNISSP